MLKRRTFDILIGLAILGLLGMYLYNQILAKKVPPAPRPGFTRANDILKRKSKIPDSILNTTATSSACTLFLKNSVELSMHEFANEFVDRHIDGILKTCRGAFPSRLESRLDKVVSECGSSTRGLMAKGCYAALVEAKTAMVGTIIKPDVDPASLDTSILLHLIADKFSSGDLLEHPHESLLLIDALLAKEPYFLSGYKIKLMLLAMSSLNSESHFEDLFYETYERALKLNPNDHDLLELALIERGEVFKPSIAAPLPPKDRKEFIAYLDFQAQRHPKEWLYDYYKAFAVYDFGNGDVAAARALVEKAMKKAPGEERLVKTLVNLDSDELGVRTRPFVMGIGFGLDDL